MGGKTQKVTNETKVPKYIEDAYKMLVSRGEGIVDTPYDPAMNRGVAGFSPTQTQAFQNIQGMQGVQNPYLQQAQQYAQTGAGTISGADIQQYSNPFQQQVIDSTMAQIAKNNAIQQNQLKGNSVAQGGLRNSRLGVAQAELAGNQDMNTANILSQLNTQNYSQALSAAQADKARQFQGASAYGTLGQQAQQAGYQDVAALLGAGQQQQGLAQQQLDTASANAAAQHQYPFQNLSWLGSLVQGVGSNAGGTSTQTQPGPSALGQAAGLAATTVGALGASGAFGSAGWLLPLLSDERAKENKKRVGWTDDGLPVFTYNYIGDPTPHMGLMAQDVEQVKPEAVGEMGGLKMVDYGRATEGFANGGPVDLDGDGMISKLERMAHAAKGIGAIQKAEGGRTEPRGIGAPQGFATGGLSEGKSLDAFNALMKHGVKMMEEPEFKPVEHINIGGRGFANGGLFEDDDDPYAADDALFNALLQQESGDRDIEGPLITAGENAGDRAFGPAQLMPKTAANPGFGVRPYNANATNPIAENRRVGRDYLNAMLNRYKGDEEAALIAYNAGPGNADKWVAAGRDYSVLPQRGQTEPYARNIMGMAGRPPAKSEGAMREALVRNAAESAAPKAGIGSPNSAAQATTPSEVGGDGWERWLPVLTAGLGMLSSGSPHAGVAIGQGGLAGVQTYMQQRKAKEGAQKLAQAAALAQQRLGIMQENLRLRQEQISQSRDAAGRRLDVQERGLSERERHNRVVEERAQTPEEVRKYQFDMEQRKAVGEPEMSYAEWRKKVSEPSYNKSPVIARREDGTLTALQFNDKGEAIETPLPKGVALSDKLMQIDTGTGTTLYGQSSQAPVAEFTKDLAGAAKQQKVGAGQGELEIAKPQTMASVRNSLSGLDRLAAAAEELKAAEGLPSMTGNLQGRSWMPTVSQATKNAETKLETLKSQVAFSILQAMRDASKSGGALGAIAVEELKMLQNNLASLDPLQDEETFKESLDAIVQYATGAKQRLLRGYRDTYGVDFDPSVMAPDVGPPPSSGNTGGFKVLKVE